METIRVSIIIVTYNSQQYIHDCLSSIEEYRDIEPQFLEVVVVDNSSGRDAEGMKKMTESHPLNQILSVKYLHNTANLGYGQGNNIGIRASSGNIVCIMNPDVRFGSSILFDVLSEFSENITLALLGYKQMGGSNYSFYQKPEFKNPLSGWIMKYMNRIEAFNSEQHYLAGAFLFLRRSSFEEVGLFDENIFMYYEEPDITNRLQKRGFHVKYKSEKIYYHLVGNRTAYSEKAFESEMNALYYYLDKYSVNKRKFLKNFLREYQLKLLAARLFGDKNRKEKFLMEMQKVKEIFGK